ncbi:MAG: YgiT-type zinc finger protein [Phycisphaerae bacterium]
MRSFRQSRALATTGRSSTRKARSSGRANAKSSTSSSPRRSPRSPSKRPSLEVCVSCGSKRVQRRQVSVRLRDGRTVTSVEADVCAACGERYYDLEAMQRLEAESSRAH